MTRTSSHCRDGLETDAKPEGKALKRLAVAALRSINRVVRRVAATTRLRPKGVLSGYTILADPVFGKQLKHHEHEFSSAEEVRDVLSRVFAHVWAFETVHLRRRNLYFWASQAGEGLPFHPANPRFSLLSAGM